MTEMPDRFVVCPEDGLILCKTVADALALQREILGPPAPPACKSDEPHRVRRITRLNPGTHLPLEFYL